jgi:hypothetical protein
MAIVAQSSRGRYRKDADQCGHRIVCRRARVYFTMNESIVTYEPKRSGFPHSTQACPNGAASGPALVVAGTNAASARRTMERVVGPQPTARVPAWPITGCVEASARRNWCCSGATPNSNKRENSKCAATKPNNCVVDLSNFEPRFYPIRRDTDAK